MEALDKLDSKDIQFLIKEMQETKGWQLVKEWLLSKQRAYTTQLIRASDLDAIRRLQGHINFIDTLLKKVDDWSSEG